MNTYVIANDNEQIILDPSDSRGQIYLHYTGPGPRYVRYSRSYIYHCVLQYIKVRSAGITLQNL